MYRTTYESVLASVIETFTGAREEILTTAQVQERAKLYSVPCVELGFRLRQIAQRTELVAFCKRGKWRVRPAADLNAYTFDEQFESMEGRTVPIHGHAVKICQAFRDADGRYWLEVQPPRKRTKHT